MLATASLCKRAGLGDGDAKASRDTLAVFRAWLEDSLGLMDDASAAVLPIVLGFVAEGYIADWWPLAIARTPVQTRVARL